MLDRHRSEWVQYLPSPYQGDDFMQRFLLIFETVFRTIESTVDALPQHLDPRTAPVEMLPYLASWVGTEFRETWPVDRQRKLILWAARLYRWRGTRRGLREHVLLYTGRAPLIVEGTNWITVTVLADDPDALDQRDLRQIIEFQKPAHVGYTLEVRRPDATGAAVSA